MGSGADILRVDVKVLACPPYFNQAIFLEAHTEAGSVARARVEYDSRIRPRNMRLNRKAHAAAELINGVKSKRSGFATGCCCALSAGESTTTSSVALKTNAQNVLLVNLRLRSTSD